MEIGTKGAMTHTSPFASLVYYFVFGNTSDSYIISPLLGDWQDVTSGKWRGCALCEMQGRIEKNEMLHPPSSVMEHKPRHCLENSFIPWSCAPLCPARCHSLDLSPCLIPSPTGFRVSLAFEAEFESPHRREKTFFSNTCSHVNLCSRNTVELSSTAGQT